MSPCAISQARPSTLARELLSRRTTRTCWPLDSSARATAEPTNPEAPVTSTRSDTSRLRDLFVCGRERVLTFHRLPRKKHRNSDRKFAGALEKRGGKTDFLRKPEYGGKTCVGNLLDTKCAGHEYERAT